MLPLLRTLLLAVAVGLSGGLGAEPVRAQSQTVFEDYEDNNPQADHFPFGDGQSVSTTSDVPTQNGGNYALALPIDATQDNGYGGVTIIGRNSIDPTSVSSFSVYVRSDAPSTFTLQIFLQEDENGNGNYNPDTEDNFKVEHQVQPGSDYERVSFEISEFTDANAAGDGQLTETVNQMAFTAVEYGSDTDFTINMDNLIFGEGEGQPPSEQEPLLDDFEDGDVSDYNATSETGSGVTASAEMNDVPPENGGSTSLRLQIDGAQTGETAGVVGPTLNGGFDPSTLDNPYFNFYVKTDASSTFGLEVALREDQNGDGSFTEGSEDTIVDSVRVIPNESGYRLVSLPVASFLDSNGNAGDNSFTEAIQVALKATGYPSESFDVNLDYLTFSSGPLADERTGTIVFHDHESGNLAGKHDPFGDGQPVMSTSDVPSQNGGSAALALPIDATQGNGYGGVTATSQTAVDPKSTEYVNLYYRSDASSSYRLELYLQEDENGDGTFNQNTEDNFRAEYQVEPGSGYRLISVPISAFHDNNSAGDGKLTEPVIQIAFTVFGYGGSEQFTINTDYLTFNEVQLGNESDPPDMPMPEEDTIRNVVELTETPRPHEKFALEVDLTAAYSNPFNFDQVNLRATFTSPSSKTYTVDGFYYQGYDRGTGKDNPMGVPDTSGESTWRVRFAPPEAGEWEYDLTLVTEENGTTTYPTQTVEVSSSSRPETHGFLRSGNNSRYLHFDDGTSYYGVGLNMGWAGKTGEPYRAPVGYYEQWMDKLSRNEGNWTRIWMVSWGFALEWPLLEEGTYVSTTPSEGAEDSRLGSYRNRLHRAYQLDKVLEHAQETGVYTQLVLNNHGQLSSGPNPEWANSPYNAANGGPLSQPEQFWTNEEARSMHKRYLRYIVARWGYSDNILAWELFNEVSLTDGYDQNTSQVRNWHREMAQYLDEIDIYDHLVTTSLQKPSEGEMIWGLEEIDLTQIHYYGYNESDPQATQRNLIQGYLTSYGRPVMPGEVSYGSWFGDNGGVNPNEVDPGGIYLHNNLWATSFSGSLGSSAPWWWNLYINEENSNLYGNFAPVGRFMGGLDLTAQTLTPVSVDVYQMEDAQEHYGPPLRGFGLRGEGNESLVAAGWVQNPRYNWQYVNAEGTPATIEGRAVRVDSLERTGTYRVELWDTSTGKVSDTRKVQSQGGTLTFELPPVTWDAAYKVFFEEEKSVELTDGYKLSSPRPNPFGSGGAEIRLIVEDRQDVQVGLYDMLGRRVQVLHQGPMTGGQMYTLSIEAGGLSSGSYFVRAVGETFTTTQKVVLVR